MHVFLNSYLLRLQLKSSCFFPFCWLHLAYITILAVRHNYSIRKYHKNLTPFANRTHLKRKQKLIQFEVVVAAISASYDDCRTARVCIHRLWRVLVGRMGTHTQPRSDQRNKIKQHSYSRCTQPDSECNAPFTAATISYDSTLIQIHRDDIIICSCAFRDTMLTALSFAILFIRYKWNVTYIWRVRTAVEPTQMRIRKNGHISYHYIRSLVHAFDLAFLLSTSVHLAACGVHRSPFARTTPTLTYSTHNERKTCKRIRRGIRI